MLWAAGNSKEQYTQGVARSTTGTLDGSWTHNEPFIFNKYVTDVAGGHGMLFTDKDGQMYVVIHSPNEGEEKVTLVPVTERNDRLVWDLNVD